MVRDLIARQMRLEAAVIQPNSFNRMRWAGRVTHRKPCIHRKVDFNRADLFIHASNRRVNTFSFFRILGTVILRRQAHRKDQLIGPAMGVFVEFKALLIMELGLDGFTRLHVGHSDRK